LPYRGAHECFPGIIKQGVEAQLFRTLVGVGQHRHVGEAVGLDRPCSRDPLVPGRGRFAWAAVSQPLVGDTQHLEADVDAAEVLPLIETAVFSYLELREAVERAWIALRQPAILRDELEERRRQQLGRVDEQARSRFTKAAVLFADGDIDNPGYELPWDKARKDLDVATEELGRLEVVEPR
jgi:hypothetical protein